MSDFLLRSLMFVPGHNKKLMAKAATTEADVLLLDLEDSVQPYKNKAKKFVGSVLEIALVGAVVVFLGIHTINFFKFIFPDDKSYLAGLGFALTSGAVVVYWYIFKFKAETEFQKVIAVVMMVLSMIGEVVAAGMGMQVEAWSKVGLVLTQKEIDTMILLVQGLALIHAVAVMLYYSLDDIIELFGDEDGDGVPNVIDKDYRGKKSAAMASDTKQAKK